MKPLSEQLFERTLHFVPGGVHSPVRSFNGLREKPVFVETAEGAKFSSVDGQSYIDFCMSFGPLILGHRHPHVSEQLIAAVSRGWTFGACEAYSLHLAEYIINHIPFIDKIRFVNSGTEAVMTALRLARGYTGRNKIIKFAGCYHGHCDSMLIKAGSGVKMVPESTSKGVPPGVAADTIVLDLDDLNAVKEAFALYPEQIAAVIIEPLPANNGLLPQTNEYLLQLTKLVQENGALMIFDEVISGFRVGFTGMAGLLGIQPDLVTYGKVIGGGLPVGALAGRCDIMDYLAPQGPVYQAGTLSANPLAMVAGLATLELLNDQFYTELYKTTEDIIAIFRKWLSTFSDAQVTHSHSLFWVNSGKTDIRRSSDIPSNLQTEFQPIFSQALEQRVYLAPNAYEVCFASAAHGLILPELESRLTRLH